MTLSKKRFVEQSNTAHRKAGNGVSARTNFGSYVDGDFG